MSDRYFPIKTATACQLKWNWSTIRLYDGTTSSCHRVDPEQLTPDTLHTFHNTPLKLQDRQAMLQGQWPGRGCEYCRDIERSGGSSDRMFHLNVPNIYPAELDSESTSVAVDPTIVEVYFDNVCNMKCLYCWDGFSSQIEQENKKFGRFEHDGVIIDNHARLSQDKEAMTESFWQWMSEHYDTLKRFHVLGGEPFYQKQFDRCLDFLEKNSNPQLEFNVISNLKVKPDKLDLYLDRIERLVKTNKIKRFDLTASIDCFGPEQEYVRFGIDLEEWKRNFRKVVDRKWIYLNINQTLSGLTIKTVPALLEHINPLRQDREIGHYFSTTVMTHNFLDPGIFGPGFFSADFDAILTQMPDQTWQQQQARNYMQGIKQRLENSQRNDDAIRRLIVFLTEMDRRRQTNWKKTFSWLEKETTHVV